jgi:hypothetical protein
MFMWLLWQRDTHARGHRTLSSAIGTQLCLLSPSPFPAAYFRSLRARHVRCRRVRCRNVRCRCLRDLELIQ